MLNIILLPFISILMILLMIMSIITGLMLIGFGLMIGISALIEGIQDSFDIFACYRLDGIVEFIVGLSFLLGGIFFGIYLVMCPIIMPLDSMGIITGGIDFMNCVYPNICLNITCWFIIGITCLIVFGKLIIVLFERRLSDFITDEMFPAIPIYLVIIALFVIIKLYFMTPGTLVLLIILALINLIIFKLSS